MSDTWTMEEAKNDFAAIAEAAYSGKSQYITDDSHPVLIISVQKVFDSAADDDEEENKRFAEFLMSGPKGDIFPEGYKPMEVIPREVEF